MGQAHRIEVNDKEMDSRRLQSSSGISGDWLQDPLWIPASEDTQVPHITRRGICLSPAYTLLHAFINSR